MTELDFAKIYAAHQPRIRNNVAKILIKGKKRADHEYYLQDVEDCVQEAFMSLWKRKDTVIDPTAYLYQVSKTVAERLREIADRHDYLDDMVTLDTLAYRQAAL